MIIEIYTVWGDLSNISANKEALIGNNWGGGLKLRVTASFATKRALPQKLSGILHGSCSKANEGFYYKALTDTTSKFLKQVFRGQGIFKAFI